jgi:hypothetical protein
MTLSDGDSIFNYKMAGRSPKRSKTELGGCYLERSSHELTKSPSVVPKSKDFGADTEDSESDTNNGQNQEIDGSFAIFWHVCLIPLVIA